jgi:two-component system, OmpR family, phosphate regulon sensor histidine kinase PhoR
MKTESVLTREKWLAVILTIATCGGIAMLTGFGYWATGQWQESSARLIERQTAESADLFAMALKRDMRGAQESVLANRDWAEFAIESPRDAIGQVSAAFARYPYPESFFSWRWDGDQKVLFYNRANRRPPWAPPKSEPQPYPVVLLIDPPEAELIRDRVATFVAARRQYAVFDIALGGQAYQVVARLAYNDPLREQLRSVVGFTVNTTWVRRSYFSEILSQVARISDNRIKFDLAVLDDQKHLVYGIEDADQTLTRTFPFLFIDPSRVMFELPHLAAPLWEIQVSVARDPTIIWSRQGARWTLLAASAAALALSLSLILAIRAIRANIALTELRSHFVASVTHGLKMPLANIRALAETMVRRPTDLDTIRDYAPLLKKEALRLTRLVNNLLSYARITNVAEAYSVDSIVPAELVDDALADYRHQLAEGNFAVNVDVPEDVSLILADRSALLLALENLIDNAIRYSAQNRSIRISAGNDSAGVFVEVRDCGIGISASELSVVRREFIRGRQSRVDGTGLGLAIVSRVVADHGGSFVLESEIGVGTAARVVLPAAVG